MDADNGFEAFFRREYAAQVRVAFLIVGDDGLAREIAQEAFARALARWERLKDYERPGAWVRLVCVRLSVRCRDRRTREAGNPAVLERLAANGAPGGDLDLAAAVLLLPRKQRAVVTLHHLCDWPMNEVAVALRIRPSTARVHLARARVSLAEALREEVPDG